MELKRAQLVQTAKEANALMGLNPPIDVANTAKISDIREKLIEVATQHATADDKFTAPAWAVLKELGFGANAEETPAEEPAEEPTGDEEQAPEEPAEKQPPAKPAPKSVSKAPAKPAPAPAGAPKKGPTPPPPPVYKRPFSVVDVLRDNGGKTLTVAQVIELADKRYQTETGKGSNPKESQWAVNLVLLTLDRAGLVVLNGNSVAISEF